MSVPIIVINVVHCCLSCVCWS